MPTSLSPPWVLTSAGSPSPQGLCGAGRGGGSLASFPGQCHFRFSQWLPVRQGRDRLSRATFGPSSVARFFPTPRAAGLSATQGGSPRSSGLVTRRSVKFPDGHPGREARKPPGALSVFLQRGIFLCQGPWIGPMSLGLTPPPSVPGALTRGIEAVSET